MSFYNKRNKPEERDANLKPVTVESGVGSGVGSKDEVVKG